MNYIIEKSNKTEKTIIYDKTYIEQFEENITNYKNNISVVYNNKFLSYYELNKIGNKLARYLNKIGNKKNERIALYLDESIEMITSIIGILKSSSSFIPMPDIFPINRVIDIIENANVKILITKRKLINNEKLNAQIVYIDEIDLSHESGENVLIENHIEDCIYNIYTSGSTGKPKGVSISNKNIINFSKYIKNRFEISEKDNFSKFAGYGFDASIIEIMPSLLNGCSIHILNKEIKSDLSKLNKYFEENNITISFLPTQFAEIFMYEVKNKSLRYLITGGEQLKKFKLNNYHIVNLYGPTETTVAATEFEILSENIDKVPIGKPIDNFKIFIVNSNMQLCSLEEEGELCIAGDGVGLGYINLPNLNSEKFIDNPFIDHDDPLFEKYSKLYRSGDLVKWLPDGNIEFLGRIDFQVKIRGFRIELGEIEQKLIHYKDIKECVAINLKDSLEQDYICAYYISNHKINEQRLKEYLSLTLPDYMIPSLFYWLEKFPINPNGKIDRKNLPIPELQIQTEYIPPNNEIEIFICETIKEILNIEKVSMTSNFLSLGGNSLKAIQFVGKIKNKFDIQVRDILKSKTILEIISKLSIKKEQIQILKTSLKKYPATKSQKGVYFASIIKPNSIIYNTTSSILIEGNLDQEKLEKSIQYLLDSNRILRSNFIIENENLIQIINEKYKFHLISENIYLNDIKNTFINFIKPFNLASYPLIRFKLLKENNEKNILFIDIHHLINDGYSQNLLIKDLFLIYNKNLKEKNEFDYLDYSLIEESLNKEKTIEFWKNNLIHFEKTQIPFDYPENDFNGEGNQIILDIPSYLYDKISVITQKLKMTPYCFFLSAFLILLYKYSRKNKVTIGGFFSGRHLAETQDMLGMFVSSLPILIEINNKNKIEEYLLEIQSKITDILENQDISLSELIEINKLNIDNGRNPFFTNTFNYVELENYHSNDINFKNINIQNKNKSNFDLSLNLFKIENKIQAIFEYSNSSYKVETVETIKEGFFQILNEITEINKYVDQIQFITPNEKNIILNKFNDTDYDFKNKLTFIEIFQEKTKVFPNNAALIFRGYKFTYHELNIIGNQIARYLKDNFVNYKDKIVIYLDESIEMISSIIGILKASASYIPIPDSFPIDRVNEILKDSNSKILITNSNFKEKIKSISNDIKVLFLDKYEYSKYDKSNLPIQTKLEDCLYHIYTSGSTGKPKGVSINNKSTINFSLNIIDKLAINEKDQFSKFAGYGFDASIIEIMPCFISGSCLHIIDKSIKLDIPKLNQYFEDNNITISFLPTQFAELFMHQTENKSLRYLLTGGDRLKTVKISNYKILNIYGPTEATVACTYYEIIRNNLKNIPIGSPLLNYKIYITDSDMNLCPIGVEGELCISGDGLAVEYIQLPELTAQKFIANPFNENKDPLFDKYSKLYRTGDLAKWLPDGNIEFIGRIDFQVKIRGFRIELGEIEQCILNINEISECLVLPLMDNNQENYLCAYYVSPVSLEDSFISNYLSKYLPDYMIPSSFYWLKSFPINQNGKIDRKNLPIPSCIIENNIVLPINIKEEFIYQCAKEVLKLNQISMNSNFFQLGGNSLKAVEFVSKIQTKFNINISDIFKYKNLKTISIHLKDKYNEKEIEKCYLDKFPITEAQKGVYFASIIDENSTIYNIPIGIEITGKLNKDKLGKSIDKLIQENRILRTKFILEESSIFQIIDENINIKKDFQKSRNEEISVLFNEFVTPFNLKESPLIRIKLIQIESNKHILFIDTHHIINDGFSHNLFIKELFHYYHNEQKSLNKLDYLDYAFYEKNNIEIRNNSVKYWEKNISKIEKTYLPFDFPEYQFNDTGNIITIDIKNDLFHKITNFSSKNNFTLYNILLSAYFILIYKIVRNQNITIGGFFSGRYLSDMQNMLGMFVSTLPITISINPEETIENFLNSIQLQISNALEHQNFSISELSNLIDSPSENGRNKFFNNAFNLIEFSENNYKDLHINMIDLKTKTRAHFDLTLNCYKLNNKIKIDFEYSIHSYKEESIKTFITSYVTILSDILENHKIIRNINFISNENKCTILSQFNNTDRYVDYSKTFIEIFEENSKKYENKTALVFKESFLSYSELNYIGNNIAYFLLKNNIKKEDKIGIYLNESIEMITSIIGILKTGASFIPMANTFPINRVIDILKNSESKILITNKATLSPSLLNLLNVKVIYIDELNLKKNNNENLNIKQDLTDCIYSIYTSGSTGKPKGLSISQKNIINLCNYYKNNFNLSINDNFSKYAGFGFDASIIEIMPILFSGGTLHIIEKSIKLDASKLNEYFEKNNITISFLPTQFSELFIQETDNQSLRYLIVGGDKLKKVIERNYKIINGYGPSETTVECTSFEVDKTDYPNIPIGKPIDNCKIYIVDQDLNLCPTGIIGELCISGHGVGLGYIHLPETNKEKFIANPFSENKDYSVIYKSGDLAKWLPDGNIEFLGRIDFQVKIRGFRIELGEIEYQLSLFPNIKECIVLSLKDHLKQDYLCAYYNSESEIQNDILVEYLSQNLPEYMIPNLFYWIEDFPINDSGKIDRKKLPIPEMKKTHHIAPRNEREKWVANYFEEILEIKQLSVLSNFFEIGGNSLKAVQLVSKIQKQYDIKVSDIFKYKSIESIAKNLKEYEIGFNIEHRFKQIKDKLKGSENQNFHYEKEQEEKYLEKLKPYYSFTPEENKDLNILVTGATGYLGSHVILELIFQTDYPISVIIRESSENSKEKLYKILNHYNGRNIPEKLLDKIQIYNGDISFENFKLCDNNFEILKNKINCVINCAANVKHYGNYDEFFQDNVIAVQNLINFCYFGIKKLHHISTYSVSMIEKISDKTNELFTEFDYRNSNLIDNYYIKTKAEAETLIHDACNSKKINANIYRVGNLVFNTNTSLHQINIENNGFYQKLKCLFNIDSICTHDSIDLTELSPINKTAQAIVLILKQKNLNNENFHIYNDKLYRLSEIFKSNSQINLNYDKLEVFIDKIAHLYKFNHTNKMLNNFMLHMGWMNFLPTTTEVTIKNDKTKLILNKLGFQWGEIKESYFEDMINHAYENRVQSLRENNSFLALDNNQIKKINSYAKLKIVDENEIILSPTNNEGSIYVILNGFAQISIKSLNGGWVSSIGILSEGDLIGIENLAQFQNKNIIIDSILGELVMLEIDKNSIVNLKSSYNSFYEAIFTYAIKSLHNNNLLISNFV